MRVSRKWLLKKTSAHGAKYLVLSVCRLWWRCQWHCDWFNEYINTIEDISRFLVCFSFRVPQECVVLPRSPKVNIRFRYFLISEPNFLNLLGNHSLSTSSAEKLVSQGNLPSTDLVIHESYRGHLRSNPRHRFSCYVNSVSLHAGPHGTTGDSVLAVNSVSYGCHWPAAKGPAKWQVLLWLMNFPTHDHSQVGENKGFEIINRSHYCLFAMIWTSHFLFFSFFLFLSFLFSSPPPWEAKEGLLSYSKVMVHSYREGTRRHCPWTILFQQSKKNGVVFRYW